MVIASGSPNGAACAPENWAMPVAGKGEVSEADLALNLPVTEAYSSDELPYPRNRHCRHRAHRDLVGDAFQVAYRLVVNRCTPARPLDRESRILLAARRQDCLSIGIGITMPDTHGRVGPGGNRNEINSASARLATHPPFAGVLARGRAMFGGDHDLRAV